MDLQKLNESLDELNKRLCEVDEIQFSKDQNKVLNLLMKTYQITKDMEKESLSGQSINSMLMTTIEKIKKIKFRPW